MTKPVAEFVHAGLKVALFPDFRGTAGFWISHLYSPWKTLSQMVAAFFAAKANPMQLQTFINTTLAELFEHRGNAPPASAIYGRREFYDIGTIPKGGLFLTAAADVQANRIEVEIRAWGKNRESWSVLYLVLDGDTSQPGVWSQLASVIMREYPHENGGKLAIWGFGVDTGYNPSAGAGGIVDVNRAYEFCRRYPQPAHGPAGSVIRGYRTVFPLKGEGGFEKSAIAFVSSPDAAKRHLDLRIVHVGTSTLKLAVFAALNASWRPGEAYPTGWIHLPDYSYDYFEGLCAESLDGKRWKKHGRNEPLDLAVYNLAVHELIRADRFRESDWAVLEERTRPAILAVPKVNPAQLAALVDTDGDWLRGRGESWF